ncbi:fused permease/ATPase component of ABC transporter involved in Fe-S cluster assembly [Beggiatoa alba B18LD]|uniref:Fused permease/ATPase component of ABC transporter involved in Fe-S cluster assembly n=1 Tax=Beggiatoa alba B18LD TaxID=395493 RepID=I3CF95_9GAMM|nr:ABC transporter ATP-binding protein/permease [Beggiatoa alba]EIJ42288.1 fused permease/ATPase component of ABC transporter involved in Fe-S cluster assembly [Beggiatoa alba B18LD]
MQVSSYLRTQHPHSTQRDHQNLRDMLPYLWDYRGRVVFALLTLVFAKLANVGAPLLLKDIVDSLDKSQQNILILPVLLLCIYGLLRLASAFFNELRDSLFARVRYHTMRQVSCKTLHHLHKLSLRFHLDRQTGAISRDLERGTRSVSSILNYLVFNIIPTLAEFLLIALILLSQYDIKFTLITFVTVAIYIAFTLAITEWRMEFRHTMNAKESEANYQAIDSLVNYETVKYFGNEAFEVQRYSNTLHAWEEAAVKSQTSMSVLNFGQSAIIAVGSTLILFYASQSVVTGHMSLGDLVLVNTFLLQLFIPLNFLGILYRAIKYALVDMDMLFRLLEQTPEIQDAPDAKPLQLTQAQVQFKNVHFHYQPDRPILHNINFNIPQGHKVAVVGASGAGKSTLARLLFRFYDVTQGSIHINGQDIRTLTTASLRTIMGIVPQDTVLFNDTIYYNIAYADPNADETAIHTAAKIANVHDFIQQLPQGYQTLVGERGLKLSGGEKQRIAIARAILKRPHILIFDEATASLDSKSEQAIQNALNELAHQHTTLVIAHRLSTIIDADEILVMEQGHIVERGTHTQLLTQQGAYAHLWQLQQQERTNSPTENR